MKPNKLIIIGFTIIASTVCQLAFAGINDMYFHPSDNVPLPPNPHSYYQYGVQGDAQYQNDSTDQINHWFLPRSSQSVVSYWLKGDEACRCDAGNSGVSGKLCNGYKQSNYRYDIYLNWDNCYK